MSIDNVEQNKRHNTIEERLDIIEETMDNQDSLIKELRETQNDQNDKLGFELITFDSDGPIGN